MSKTETTINDLKINRGTYANIQDNISEISENELILTTDKNVPIPQISDEDKLIKVNASGEFELGKSLPYITTAPSANNTKGLIIVVLDSEPAIKYDGYLYIITESSAPTTFTNIHISYGSQGYDTSTMSIDGGTATAISDQTITSCTSLSFTCGSGFLYLNIYIGTAQYGRDLLDTSINENETLDVTQYLADGCYVTVEEVD